MGSEGDAACGDVNGGRNTEELSNRKGHLMETLILESLANGVELLFRQRWTKHFHLTRLTQFEFRSGAYNKIVCSGTVARMHE